MKSDLWLDSLKESLQNLEYTAEYLTVILEDDPQGDQILRVTLQDIIKARQSNNSLSKEAEQYYEQLEQIFSQNQAESIFLLIKLLDALDLKINISVKS
jgi:DNA-binding phage protein